jgi:phenylacetate-CoA ligase
MFAVPLREVVRVHSTSGTMTNPQVVGYTRQDLSVWSHLVARILTAGGVSPDDVIQITFAYGLMTGGLGIHYGAERIGASVLPTSVGRTDRQIKIMQDYRTTVLVSTPSYTLVMAERGTAGVDRKTLSLKYCICAENRTAEPARNRGSSVREATDITLSEVIGPGVAGECLEQQGMHLQDHS